jgi:hypothetical protein
MLAALDPRDYVKVSLFFKILIPHCLLRYLEIELRSRANVPFIMKSIDEFIDPRRTAHFSSSTFNESERYQTSPIFSTWLMKTLKASFKFNFT